MLILDSGLQTRGIVSVCSSWPSSLSSSITAAIGQTTPLPGSQRHRLGTAVRVSEADAGQDPYEARQVSALSSAGSPGLPDAPWREFTPTSSLAHTAELCSPLPGILSISSSPQLTSLLLRDEIAAFPIQDFVSSCVMLFCRNLLLYFCGVTTVRLNMKEHCL